MSAFQIRALLGAAALGALAAACADDPPAPTSPLPSAPAASIAEPFTVTNTNDAGIGSLRWVLSYADSGQTVRFDPALAGQTITLDSTLTHNKAVNIEGPADKGITISGGGKTRVFFLSGYGADTLRNLSITGGYDKFVSAIFGSGMHVVVMNSTVYGNTATGDGTSASTGAINAPRLSIVNSTISGNTSPGQYSTTVASSGKLDLINSTIAFNTGGGFISGMAGNLVRNSILSNNTSRNCHGGPTSVALDGSKLLSDDDSCGGPDVIMIGDPKLQPLADNGGPTMTHALPVGSPAINAGTSCTVQVDQRYAGRDEKCDLGAYEFADPTTVALTIDAGAAVNQANGWAVVTGSIKCSRNETFNLAVELKQVQKVGRDLTDVHAAATVPITCMTGVRPWSASMYPTEGTFKTGSAEATAGTMDAPGWVTPAATSSEVKLYWGRR